MSRGLFIGGLAVGGGIALAALAFREREPLGRGAVAVHLKAQQAVRKGVRKVAETVKELTGKPSQAKLDLIAQYNIAALVKQYMGVVPFGVAMTMMEHESGFDPYIYNWTKKDPAGGKPTYPKASAKPRAPIVEIWEKPWDGGFEHDPHAVGLYQILDGIRIKLDKKRVAHKPYSYGGVPLPNLNDLIDPEKNIHAALAGRNSDAKAILAAVPGASGVLLAELIYLAHTEGLGVLVGGRGKIGAFAKLKEQNKAVNWANIVALPWGVGGWWVIHNQMSNIAGVAGRAAVWEKLKASLLGEPSVQVETGEEPADPETVASITQSTVDVLIAQAQEAEMERDLDTAAALREQIAALQTTTPDGGVA